MVDMKYSSEIVICIKTERAIVHGNWELIRFAAQKEKVNKTTSQRAMLKSVSRDCVDTKVLCINSRSLTGYLAYSP